MLCTYIMLNNVLLCIEHWNLHVIFFLHVDALLSLAKYIFFLTIRTSGYRKTDRIRKLWHTWEYFWNRKGEAGPPPFSKNFERVATRFITLSTYFLYHEFMRTFIHTYITLHILYIRTFIRIYVYTYVRSYICLCKRLCVHTFIHTFICTYIYM